MATNKRTGGSTVERKEHFVSTPKPTTAIGDRSTLIFVPANKLRYHTCGIFEAVGHYDFFGSCGLSTTHA